MCNFLGATIFFFKYGNNTLHLSWFFNICVPGSCNVSEAFISLRHFLRHQLLEMRSKNIITVFLKLKKSIPAWKKILWKHATSTPAASKPKRKNKKLCCWQFLIIILDVLRMDLTHDFWLSGVGETIALPVHIRRELPIKKWLWLFPSTVLWDEALL